MKNKISILVTVLLVSISGILVFADNNLSNNKQDSTLVQITPEQLDVMGTITNIKHEGDNIIIRIEAVKDENIKDGIDTLNLKPEARYDIADVIINKNTIIKKSDSDKLLKASDIKQNQRVEVKFEKIEGRSYPVYANAYSIMITDMNNY
ncbi:Uncharacterised protein [uncultured Clostridium sp.]|nr:Uncharacterised protein [uncultured Clostridium sp.]SCI98797.1 Uncharacterised protein [uncultured Clostridium sp.]